MWSWDWLDCDRYNIQSVGLASRSVLRANNVCHLLPTVTFPKSLLFKKINTLQLTKKMNLLLNSIKIRCQRAIQHITGPFNLICPCLAFWAHSICLHLSHIPLNPSHSSTVSQVLKIWKCWRSSWQSARNSEPNLTELINWIDCGLRQVISLKC